MKIELKNITKRYGKHCVLNSFSAEFSEGIYGLLGPNGAGKSTLINIIVGLLRKNGGTIRFDGKDIENIGENYLNDIGYLPQYPKFYGNFTVLEFMRYMAALKHVRKSEMQGKIHSLLQFVNLEDAANKKTSALSGGMRQRLGIAQALLNDPKLLILDEPTAGLDPKERIRFRSLMTQIAADRTILLATHIVSDVSFIANEILLLQNGVKIQQDTPEHLLAAMQGKVWQVTVPEQELHHYLAKYSISNARHTEKGYALRIVAEHMENGTLTEPNLEDVYLYYFGECEN